MVVKFKSLSDLSRALPDEESCIAYLEWIVWKGGKVVSPYDPQSKVYKCKGHNYKCSNTGKYFNARTNTMFYRSSVPLQKWFMAIWLFTTHKKGISSVQLSKDIGVTQKTAWAMLHRIRQCFGKENKELVLEGIVEIDETSVGGKNKNRHKDKKVKHCKGRSFKDKTPVFGMLQRGGKVVAKVVKDTTAKTLRTEIYKTVKEGSIIYSDEWSYGDLSDKYSHSCVYHCYGIYGIGDITTNSIEGFWSIFKRGIIGVYHRVSRKHLQKYADEFAWRYAQRMLPLQQAFENALNCLNHRVTYKDLMYAYEKA